MPNGNNPSTVKREKKQCIMISRSFDHILVYLCLRMTEEASMYGCRFLINRMFNWHISCLEIPISNQRSIWVWQAEWSQFLSIINCMSHMWDMLFCWELTSETRRDRWWKCFVSIYFAREHAYYLCLCARLQNTVEVPWILGIVRRHVICIWYIAQFAVLILFLGECLCYIWLVNKGEHKKQGRIYSFPGISIVVVSTSICSMMEIRP
jgi:hypothetical protein